MSDVELGTSLFRKLACPLLFKKGNLRKGADVKQLKLTGLFAFLFFSSIQVFASPIEITPAADGTVSSFGIVSDERTISVTGTRAITVRGIIEFDIGIPLHADNQVLLSMNPWSLPLHGEPLSVYAYQGADGLITVDDYDSGLYIGAWDFPGDITWGQEDFFDVTNFVLSAGQSLIGFNIRGTSLNSFSSTEMNLGTGPKLLISTVPEPSSILLLLSSLIVFVTPRRNS